MKNVFFFSIITMFFSSLSYSQNSTINDGTLPTNAADYQTPGFRDKDGQLKIGDIIGVTITPTTYLNNLGIPDYRATGSTHEFATLQLEHGLLTHLYSFPTSPSASYFGFQDYHIWSAMGRIYNINGSTVLNNVYGLYQQWDEWGVFWGMKSRLDNNSSDPEDPDNTADPVIIWTDRTEGGTKSKFQIIRSTDGSTLSQQLTIDKDGDVNIGSSYGPLVNVDIDYKLEVNGTGKYAGNLHGFRDYLLGPNSNNNIFIIHPRWNNNGDYLQITMDDGAGSWKWSEGIFLKRSNSSVGIGTASPGSKLEVNAGTGNGLLVSNTLTSGAFNYNIESKVSQDQTKGFAVTQSGSDKMVIYGDGQIDIGATGQNTYDISISSNGALAVGGTWVDGSDRKLKKDIKPITNAMDLVMKLRGVSYFHDQENNPQFHLSEGKNLGFIAQELLEVIPEVVQYDSALDLYGVKYSRIIPVLTEGIKEQQGMIEELNSEVQELRSKIEEQNIFHYNPTDNNIHYKLDQNRPNPFSGFTTISYEIPGDFAQAYIGIYDLKGLQKQLAELPAKEHNGEITIHDQEIGGPGQYIYSLIVDGKPVSTKKMVVIGH